MENVKIGLMGVGLNTYWEQFEGLLDRLIGYQNKIKNKMQSLGNVTVIDAGMVDDSEKADRVTSLMKSEDVEILFIYISTYALSSTIIPIANRLNIPVILLNIQPLPAIEYDKLNSMGDRGSMTGEWLANCQACSIPEFCSVFNRTAIRYEIVSGYVEDRGAGAEISQGIKAAEVV